MPPKNKIMRLKVRAVPALMGLMLLGSAGGLQAWSPGNPFVRLCLVGTLEEMTAALAAGADLNAPDMLSTIPLTAAARDSNGLAHAKVELLLKAGVDPSSREVTGDTALHYAARRGDLAVMRILLEAGADMSLKTNLSGHTPLHEAAGGGRPEAVKMLLSAGAEVNAEDNSGDTPLIWAFIMLPPREREPAESIARLLLSHGAAVNADTLPLNLLAVMAETNASPGTLKMLLEAGFRINAPFGNGATALMAAAERAANSRGVAFLLENGADVALRDRDGLTALDHARLNQTPAAEEIISLLEEAEKQAEVDFRQI